jgi:hypothetical protein
VDLRLDGVGAASELAAGAGYAGVIHCGKWAVCPVCAAEIARARAEEIGEFLGWVTDQGHTAAFMTLTLRHHKGNGLDELVKAVRAAWDSVTSGRFWVGDTDAEYAAKVATWEDKLAYEPKRRPNERDTTYDNRCAKRMAKLQANRPVRKVGLRDRYGLLGFIRAFEATYGDEHGWHPHLHIVLVFEDQLSPAMVRNAGEEIWDQWCRTLNSRGFDAVREVWDRDQGRMVPAGFDIQASTQAAGDGLAKYLVKQLALEVTQGATKTGRSKPGESKKSRTPFQLLADVIDNGDADALDLWHEWERVMHSRKQITWSEGLRELAGMRQETTDEDLVGDDRGGTVYVPLPPETWIVVREMAELLLFAADDGGLTAALAWLDERGLAYGEPILQQPRAPGLTA